MITRRALSILSIFSGALAIALLIGVSALYAQTGRDRPIPDGVKNNARMGAGKAAKAPASAFITFPSGNGQTDAFPGVSGPPGAQSANTATGYGAVVGAGNGNMASAEATVVAGGDQNYATGGWSTVSGGYFNTASGLVDATVAGGSVNEAQGNGSTVGGGYYNFALGDYATIPGGDTNYAAGTASFAAGYNANAVHDHSFVWGDSGGGTSAGINTFNIHASNGIFLNGGAHASSDRDKKEAFRKVDPSQILDKVSHIPIKSWRFKAEKGDARHIGPTSQDFLSTFGYGTSDRYITSVDADGVALAAIQALEAKVKALEASLAELRAELASAK